jgi:hypothetical protein
MTRDARSGVEINSEEKWRMRELTMRMNKGNKTSATIPLPLRQRYCRSRKTPLFP